MFLIFFMFFMCFALYFSFFLFVYKILQNFCEKSSKPKDEGEWFMLILESFPLSLSEMRNLEAKKYIYDNDNVYI